MSILRKSYVCQIALGLAILAAPSAMFAVSNPDCTLIVPANPLSAGGLATPYQLVQPIRRMARVMRRTPRKARLWKQRSST